MLVYILLLGLTFFLWNYSKGNKQVENHALFILIAFMAFLCAFRGMDCGTDNVNYQKIFDTKNNSREYEILFDWTINNIPTFRLWMVSFAFASYALLYYIVKKEVLYCTVAVLIFMVSPGRFFPETFNIVRQVLGATIILWAFYYWKENKLLFSVGLIILASFFHTSSLIALPFLLLKKVKFSISVTLTILGASIVLGMAGSYSSAIRALISSDAMMSLSGIETLDAMGEHYANYGNSENTMNFAGLGMRILPLSFLCYLCRPESEEESKKDNFYFNIFLISTALNNIIIPSMAWGIRFMFSLQLVQILSVPLAYQFSKGNRKLFFQVTLVILALLYVYYLMQLPNTGIRPIVPYQFSTES